MTNALFVGRFQPFHLGHLLAIKEILRKNDHVFIVIGSARQSKTWENPFSVEERIEMIKNSIEAEGIMNFDISSVEDFHDDKLWTAAIRKAFKFDSVYSQNEWTLDCFKRNGIKVKRHRFYHKRKYSGINIRKIIAEGKEWQHLVPPEVYDYIKKIGGEERIKKISPKQILGL